VTTFLFWNINRKPLSELVARLAEEHGIDVIILAESQIEPARLLTGLNENGLAQFHYAPTPGGSTVSVFTRFSARFLRNITEWLALLDSGASVARLHFGPSRNVARSESAPCQGKQVLIRPALLSRLPVPGVKIVTKVRQASLLGANGCPDREIGSDHLPIVFSLDLEGVGE
jgi:hypothetical protein